MQVETISRKYREICRLVTSKRIKEALVLVETMIRQTGMGDHRIQLEHLESTYRQMLKYTLEGVQDPDRQRIYNKLLASILQLAQDVREHLMSHHSGWHLYWLKEELGKEQKLSGVDIVEKLQDLTFKKELDELLRESAAISEEAYTLRSKKYKELRIKIFRHLWLSDKYREAELELVKIIRNRERFSWYDRSVFVSAVTLSLIRYFHEEKFRILFDLFEEGEDQVWQRALTGLVFALYHFDSRLFIFPEIMHRLEAMAEKPGIEKNLEIIILQIIRSRETEKISRRLREEIIPEMAKLTPNIQEKLDLDNLLKDDLADERNPDWKEVFEDSEDLFGKMEEFSRLQMEGADVFMSAFSLLKHFDFFREISNWFLPFYPENDIIDESLGNEDAIINRHAFIEGLYRSAFLCNSDKYSFILNVKQMPSKQKNMVLKLFSMELDGMRELTEQENMHHPEARNQAVFTQYIQDLYRFFKLYPDKREFPDIFTGKLNIYDAAFFRELINDRNIIRKIGEYFFEKDYFEEALEIYLRLLTEEPSAEITEKTAYCYQRLGDYQAALKYYKQAELFETNRLWNLKKIAFCYRKMKMPREALEYYTEAEKLQPDDLYLQASIGRCYLDLKKYDQALKYYFKVEFQDHKNKKVLRPIAWCYYVTGKLDKARKYMDKIPDEDIMMYDMVNRGHMEWSAGNRQQAVEWYRRAILEKKLPPEKLTEMVAEDTEILTSYGINRDDIPILLDYLLYSLDNE
ncbi:MAG: tetratricopeptide repeat protein [Bacteroidales bacterium]